MTTQLKPWIITLRNRNITIHTHPDGPQLTGPTTTHDHHMAQQHQAALTHAPHHPTWWNAVRTGNHTGLTPDDIPRSPTNPDDYACTTCNQPAPWLDHNLLPWCDHHRPQGAHQ